MRSSSALISTEALLSPAAGSVETLSVETLFRIYTYLERNLPVLFQVMALPRDDFLGIGALYRMVRDLYEDHFTVQHLALPSWVVPSCSLRW